MSGGLRRKSTKLLSLPPLIAAVVAFTTAAAQPLSYSSEVAPILALNCHACHGANPESVAGGLSTRTWADLNKGGNLGPVIVPGDPVRSPLYQFVSGARGEPHRMPLGGPPLAAAQIAAIGKWIVEGASEDTDASKTTYLLDLPAVHLERSTPVRISARIPAACYVELELADSGARTLYREGGAVKAARDSATIGVIGEWMMFELRRGSDWPERVRARLTIRYAASEPANAMLVATGDTSGPGFPEGEADLRVISPLDQRVVLHRREQVRGGLAVPERLKRELAPGLYVLQIHTERRTEAAILFRAGDGAR